MTCTKLCLNWITRMKSSWKKIPWDFNYEFIALCETVPICIAFYEHKSKCGQRIFQNRKPFDKIRWPPNKWRWWPISKMASNDYREILHFAIKSQNFIWMIWVSNRIFSHIESEFGNIDSLSSFLVHFWRENYCTPNILYFLCVIKAASVW